MFAAPLPLAPKNPAQQELEMNVHEVAKQALEAPFSPVAGTPFSTNCSSPIFDAGVPRKHAIRRRKGTPSRGPESAFDARFQGITFSFASVPLKRTADDYLHIIDGPRFTETFESLRQSDEHVVPSPSALHNNTPSPLAAHSEHVVDSDGDATEMMTGPDGQPKPKQCACCGCTSTPLWRDLGKTQPLCNACGIRWKKYGVICDSCQYVPCKQERDSKTCRRCAAPFTPSVKRSRTGSPVGKRHAQPQATL